MTLRNILMVWNERTVLAAGLEYLLVPRDLESLVAGCYEHINESSNKNKLTSVLTRFCTGNFYEVYSTELVHE